MTSAGAWSFFVEINLAQPPFDDVHVRRALALALDRPASRNRLGRTGRRRGFTDEHCRPGPTEGHCYRDRFDSENGPDS